MQKHLLVTVSDEGQDLYGVQFICGFFKQLSEHRLTLLHIYRLDSGPQDNPLTEMWNNPDDSDEGRLSTGGRKALDRATRILARSQMSIDAIKNKTVRERYGKVRDILQEGAAGLYDAIVLGRRASYTLQWLFERPAEEIPQMMVRDSQLTCPVWICPQPNCERKNVLVAIDGSANSLRAVDHVGYMLSLQDQHTITLFHVENSSSADKDEMFGRAEKILHEHQINQERISRKSIWSFMVPGAILAETEQGGYGGVAVGLHGQTEGLLKEYNLAGGVTAKLITRIEKSSLWCCP